MLQIDSYDDFLTNESQNMTMKKGARILRARKATGLSQQALAEMCGVSRNAVTLWETDEERGTNPTMENYRSIASATGFNLLWLIDGTPPERSGAAKIHALTLEDEELFAACLKAVEDAVKEYGQPVSTQKKAKALIDLYNEFSSNRESPSPMFEAIIGRFALRFLKGMQ